MNNAETNGSASSPARLLCGCLVEHAAGPCTLGRDAMLHQVPLRWTSRKALAHEGVGIVRQNVESLALLFDLAVLEATEPLRAMLRVVEWGHRDATCFFCNARRDQGQTHQDDCPWWAEFREERRSAPRRVQ